MSDLLLNKKRSRVDSDESPEVKRLRDDLLSNLDDSDLFVTSPDPFATSLDPLATSSDLDSFIKTFENEISPPTVVDLTSDSGDSVDSGDGCTDLGFLFGASDDELGIPPASEERFSDEIGELWRYEDELPIYDSFEYDNDIYLYNDNNIGYEYSDPGLDFYEAPLPLWRPETAL